MLQKLTTSYNAAKVKKDELYIKPAPVQVFWRGKLASFCSRLWTHIFFCGKFSHFNTGVCWDWLVFGERLKWPLKAWRLPLGFHTWKLKLTVQWVLMKLLSIRAICTLQHQRCFPIQCFIAVIINHPFKQSYTKIVTQKQRTYSQWVEKITCLYIHH